MKQVGLYAVLLGAALIGSYLTWSNDDGKPAGDEDGGVPVYAASAGDVKKLAWDAPKLKVLAERREDAAGPYVWVAIDETKEKPAPKKPHAHGGPDDPHGEGDTDTDTDTDAAAGPEAPEPPPEVEVVHTEFLGSEAATGLFESFEPLMALRELPAEGDAAAFGFDEDAAKLVVGRAAGELTIDVGGETYGAKDRYARHGGKVVLLEDTTVRPLQFALTRLQETRLHPFGEADLERVSVTRDGAARVWAQQNKDDRAAAYWALESSPESREETAATWIGKLLRMKAQSYPAEVPETTPVFAVALASGKASWTVEILKAAEADEYYARSSFNRATVKLTPSLASEAVADVDELFQE